MKKDLLNEKNFPNPQNIIIDAEYVVGQKHILEILVFVGFVWESMQENELWLAWGKQAGNIYFYLMLIAKNDLCKCSYSWSFD